MQQIEVTSAMLKNCCKEELQLIELKGKTTLNVLLCNK